MSLENAQNMIAAGLAYCRNFGYKMNLAVVDSGGHLLAFARMDGAWKGSVDIAIRKAKTAQLFNLPTKTLGQLSQPGGDLYGIEHSNGGLITFPGGLPLPCGGAVGVSGGSVSQDQAVADVMVLS